MQLHIGIDDTDSRTKGMCTTYVGSLIVKELVKKGVQLTDYPQLIRLNPNIPFKTRGNGAVALRVEAKTLKEASEVKRLVRDVVEKNYVKREEDTNPGIVFYEGAIHPYLTQFYKKSLTEVVTVKEANQLAKQVGAVTKKYENGRGVIGALAAIGADLSGDYTYELIAYRFKKNWKKQKRGYDLEAVKYMDEVLGHLTFANMHKENPRLFPQGGTDPVYCGIRGETSEAVIKAFEMIHKKEKCDFYSIWRTNQATNPHFPERRVEDLHDYHSGKVYGVISKNPEYYGAVKGKKHVYFELEDDTGTITCTAYEPTKEFRKTVANLVRGDKVVVYGGVRPSETVKDTEYPKSVNIERFDTLELIELCKLSNPECEDCGGKTSSLGTNKGFKCKKCGTECVTAQKNVSMVKRGLLEQESYTVPVCAIRHLTKPKEREGRRQQPFKKPDNLNEVAFKKL